MTATDVAYSMCGLMQAVIGTVWLLGGWLMGDTRRAAMHWAAFAWLSTISFALLTVALHVPQPQPSEMLRAIGNITGVVAIIALQRGIWLFAGCPFRNRAHAFALGVVLVSSYIGLSPSQGAIRVSLNSAVLALLCISMARDLHRHARATTHLRLPWLLALPLLCAALGFGTRGVRAILWPDTVTSQMITDSALNVGSALSYAVIALVFHATLMTLVVVRLLAELRHRSRHDGLTGLLNRRAMEEALDLQLQRSRRTGEVFAVLMLDLDHFKSINDRYGHAVGDRALKHASSLLKAEVREVDRLARFGGEEFLALMPGATLEAARPVANRLREALVGNPFLVETDSITLSVSIGIAEWIGAAEDASRLVVRADAALYRAKLLGRDRVVEATPESFSPPVAQQPPNLVDVDRGSGGSLPEGKGLPRLVRSEQTVFAFKSNERDA